MNSERPRLLIAGAGYVGSALAQWAVAQGWDVWALSRNSETLAALSKLGVCPVQGVLDDVDAWSQKAPRRVDFVVNLVSSADRSTAGYRASYIDGQKALMGWAESVGARRYIYSSSTSVYGEHDGGWVDEDTSPAPATQFGEILLEAESLVASSSLDATVLRLGGIYGPGRHVIWNQVEQAEGRTLPGFGDIYLNLIFRDDIVGAVTAALACRHLPRRLYNIVDTFPAPRQAIVDWICKTLDREALRYDPEAHTQDARGRRYAGGRRPNRRIRSAYAASELAWEPAMVDFRSGYRALFEQQLPDARWGG